MELLFSKTRRDLLKFFIFGFAFSQCKEDETNPFLSLIYPNGKEILGVNSAVMIRWEFAKIEFIDLHYSFDNGKTWKIIATKVAANTSMFEWKMPVLNNEAILIRVKDSNENGNLFDISDGFEVWQNAKIKLSEHTELNKIGGIKLFDNAYFGDFAIVKLGDGQFQVLSLACTHLGCRVNWENNIFECPCHHATFDKKGCVKNGPAQEPLYNFYHTFDSEQDIITVYRKELKGGC